MSFIDDSEKNVNRLIETSAGGGVGGVSWSTSTSHVWPCGLCTCLAVTWLLHMRRRTVSWDTFRCVAACAIVSSM